MRQEIKNFALAEIGAPVLKDVEQLVCGFGVQARQSSQFLP